MDSHAALFGAQANEKESIMKLKRTMLAVLAGTAAMASASAFADNGWHGGNRHWDHRHGYHNAPRAVVVVPAPRVVYAQPRVVYAPPVVYPGLVYPSAPRYYQAAPVYAPAAPGISIRLRLPL